jgi:hypothetical protein
LLSESKYFSPYPKTNIIIDPHLDVAFPNLIKIQITGDSKRTCEAVKTVLFNCSQHVLRTRPALEDAQCGIPAADGLMGNVASGSTLVIKMMMKQEYFLQLTTVRIEDSDVFQRLKSKYAADIIFVPSAQKFSNSLEFLCQVYLIGHEDSLYNAFEDLIDFMALTKGKLLKY